MPLLKRLYEKNTQAPSQRHSPCGTYIANATVTLTTRSGTEINTTQTDSTGHYAFANVSPDYYDKKATSTQIVNPRTPVT
jgi:predicted double-glycine peptidase